MTPPRTIDDFVMDMIREAQLASSFVQGFTCETLRTDPRTLRAVVRCIEIIGEAARRIPKTVTVVRTEIPWSDIVGMRHKLIHDYFTVDVQRVWQTLIEDLPALVPLLQQLQKDLNLTADSKQENL